LKAIWRNMEIFIRKSELLQKCDDFDRILLKYQFFALLVFWIRIFHLFFPSIVIPHASAGVLWGSLVLLYVFL
jgi:hypothetical protein